jgi:hypothetical protein
MNQSGSLDQAKVTKYSFLLAVGLFVAGVLDETLLPLFLGELPAWERMLFPDFEAIGIVLALISVFGFGIVRPLVE